MNPFLVAALKAATYELNKYSEILKVDNNSEEYISLSSNNVSSASASASQYQKWVRLSIS